MWSDAIFREAESRDLDTLHSYYMHESVVYYMGFDYVPREDFDKLFAELAAEGKFLVYESANRILGACRVVRRSHRMQHVAYIGTTVVDPNEQHAGIGTSMMRTLLHDLYQDGVRRFEVFVACDNTNSVSFFKKLGFQVEGHMKNFFRRSGASDYSDEYMLALLLD